MYLGHGRTHSYEQPTPVIELDQTLFLSPAFHFPTASDIIHQPLTAYEVPTTKFLSEKLRDPILLLRPVVGYFSLLVFLLESPMELLVFSGRCLILYVRRRYQEYFLTLTILPFVARTRLIMMPTLSVSLRRLNEKI